MKNDDRGIGCIGEEENTWKDVGWGGGIRTKVI